VAGTTTTDPVVTVPAPDAPVQTHVIAGRDRLLQAGLSPDTAALDAEVLAREVLSWDRAQFLARRHEAAPPGFAAHFETFLTRRETREPVSQILGRREFWGRPFIVTRDVLTPRPETELIVDSALALYPRAATGALRIVDAGTGSGCLAVTLACEWPEASLIATDVSMAALHIAARNAGQHDVRHRVRIVRADLLDGVGPDIDLIVSNPPYVPDNARSALARDVRDYEPEVALFGGADGFAVIERLLDQAAGLLRPSGRLIMEFGAGQDDRLREIVSRWERLRVDAIREDVQGIPRVAIITRT
jgi:release factor glutamine methyltransferase